MKWLMLTFGSVLIIVAIYLILNKAAGNRQVTKWLLHSWKIERIFYRHHRITGTLLFIGASVFLALLSMIPISDNLAIKAFWQSPRGLYIALVVQGLAWILAMLSLLIGLTVLLRPSLLKPLERYANRQIIDIESKFFHRLSIPTALMLTGGITIWGGMSL